MKLTKQSDTEYFGRFEQGEELKAALEKFCTENNIQSAGFSIIGAISKSEISFYNQTEKKYLNMALDEEAEILNCTGNISLKDGKPFMHAHVTLSDPEGKAYGGHLVSARVFSAEIYLKTFEKPLKRVEDKSTGLGLLEEK